MSYLMDELDIESNSVSTYAVKKGSSYSRNTHFLFFTFAFVLGNLVLQNQSQLKPFSFFSSITCCCILGVYCYYSSFRVPKKTSFKVCLLIITGIGFASGYARAYLQAEHYLRHSLAANIMSQDLRIPACISSLPIKQGGLLRFIVDPIKPVAHPKHNLKRIRITANMKYLKTAEESLNFKAGDCWDWDLRIKTTRGLRNQHSFDYEKWLYTQNISATGYLRKAPDKLNLKKYPWLSFRARIADEIKSAIPSTSNSTGLLLGLTLGIRDDISSEQWSILQKTGTSHLLAISGLHIGIAALFGFLLGKALYFVLQTLFSRVFYLTIRPSDMGLVVAMLGAVFYAAMAGFSVSTQRACIMFFVVAVSLLCTAKFKATSVFSVALLVVLLIDPIAILSAGTWFSFFAVLIILILSKRDKSLDRKSNSSIRIQINKLVQGMRLQFFLLVFLVVPVSLVFSKWSLVSPLINFIFIPIFTFIVVPVLLVALVFIKLLPGLSYQLISWESAVLDNLWKVLQECSKIPVAAVDLQLNPKLALAFCLLLIPVVLPKGVLSKAYSSLLLIALLTGFTAQPINEDELALTVFDVGQGLSVLLRTANQTLLFDTGPKFRSGSSSAERVLKPWLDAENITDLSSLIISHSDNDHAGGLEFINSTFEPKITFAPKNDRINFTRACEAGYRWIWDGVKFEFLYPFRETLTTNTNNLSCVLRVSLNERSILLTGDIEKEAEGAMLKEYADLQHDIVLVPHHGSRTSSTLEFVNKLQAKIAIIPAGFANRWRFPKPDILQRWQDSTDKVFTIADSGELSIHIDKQGRISTQTWISSACRYWHQDCKNKND